jgi:hypothetical protein
MATRLAPTYIQEALWNGHVFPVDGQTHLRSLKCAACLPSHDPCDPTRDGHLSIAAGHRYDAVIADFRQTAKGDPMRAAEFMFQRKIFKPVSTLIINVIYSSAATMKTQYEIFVGHIQSMAARSGYYAVCHDIQDITHADQWFTLFVKIVDQSVALGGSELVADRCRWARESPAQRALISQALAVRNHASAISWTEPTAPLPHGAPAPKRPRTFF